MAERVLHVLPDARLGQVRRRRFDGDIDQLVPMPCAADPQMKTTGPLCVARWML
jgi:hypothetical protein